jgi:hypothetical protein
MPTRPSKGNHGHPDSGSKGRGGQKATYGSAVSSDVAEGRVEAGAADADADAEERDSNDR